jgi:hypothetical protein
MSGGSDMISTKITELSSSDENVRSVQEPLLWPESTFPAPDPAAGLPYHDLGPRGLERLCFQLLVQNRYVPRFFGEPGQAQYGIDLLVDTETGSRVYQCKNLDHSPSVGEIRTATEKFQNEWLRDHELH